MQCTQRRHPLAQVGLDFAPLPSIDLVDAALCALTAHQAASGAECRSFGEASRELIIVPRGRTPIGA